MSKLIEDFKEIRKVSTPWCVVRTTDYMATIRTLLRIRVNGEPPPACFWTCTDGVVTPISLNTQEALSKPTPVFATPDDAPHMMLKNAAEQLESDSILFMVLPDNTLLDNTFCIQAISNVRDVFKMNRRTLVFLGLNPKMPPFLAEDIPILEDPLPDKEELQEIVKGMISLYEAQANAKLPKVDYSVVANMCLGMTRFAAEEAVSRKIRKTGLDLPGLALSRQAIVEDTTNRALTFERESWTFEEIGGLTAYKAFMTKINSGPKKPTLVVRIDEIDKSITAASSGAVVDNTGTSQDILKTLLTTIEDNKWMGLLAVGGPGTGKTLASICTANQFGTRALAFDLGAVKDKYVGETEGKIRRVMEVIKIMGGENVLFIATANRLDTLPPELRRRFWLGTWFWDLPTEEEKKAIWKIQRERFKIDPKDKVPSDTDWTGSDIRNCCQMAWVTQTTLQESSEYITIAGITSRTQIEALRDTAVKSGFRSANYTGAYKRPETKSQARRLV